jgi:hypothetical protein
MQSITLSRGVLKVSLLSEMAYRERERVFYQNELRSDDQRFDLIVNEKRSTEELLRDALATLWIPGEEFEVGTDYNLAFTMCGGLYSGRCLKRALLGRSCSRAKHN